MADPNRNDQTARDEPELREQQIIQFFAKLNLGTESQRDDFKRIEKLGEVLKLTEDAPSDEFRISLGGSTRPEEP